MMFSIPYEAGAIYSHFTKEETGSESLSTHPESHSCYKIETNTHLTNSDSQLPDFYFVPAT